MGGDIIIMESISIKKIQHNVLGMKEFMMAYKQYDHQLSIEMDSS